MWIKKKEKKIDNHEIEQTTHTQFLGVIIDSKFSWNKQIQHLCNKVSKTLESKCIGILSKVKGLLLKETQITLYHSLAFPYLIYSHNVWAITHSTKLLWITILPKDKIVCMICNTNSHYQAHTSPLFQKLKILKFVDINIYKTTMNINIYHNA